jgi:hypothetical protein
LNFHQLKEFPQKDSQICENLSPKTKQKIMLWGGGGGVIQRFNAKFSPNCVSFTSTKIKFIVTLLEKII